MAQNSGEDVDVVERARLFIRQRDDHRAKLRAELIHTLKRAREIQTLLAEFGDEEAGDPQFSAEFEEEGEDVEQVGGPGAKPVIATVPLKLRPTVPKLVRRSAVGKTVAQLVERVVNENPGGLPAGDVVKGVLALNPKMKPTTIYPTIYRMRDDGRLTCTGEKGESRYFPKGANVAAE